MPEAVGQAATGGSSARPAFRRPTTSTSTLASSVRFAAISAYRYLRDVIDIFESHDWDWTYHAFRGTAGASNMVRSGATSGQRRCSTHGSREVAAVMVPAESEVERSDMKRQPLVLVFTLVVWTAASLAADPPAGRIVLQPQAVRCRSRRSCPDSITRHSRSAFQKPSGCRRGDAGEFPGGKDRVAGAGCRGRCVVLLRAESNTCCGWSRRRQRGCGDDDRQPHEFVWHDVFAFKMAPIRLKRRRFRTGRWHRTYTTPRGLGPVPLRKRNVFQGPMPTVGFL